MKKLLESLGLRKKPKVFFLAASEIRPLAEGQGACFASDQITVDGLQVRYMYREKPDNEYDSGWRFFSGSESDDYVDNPKNIGIYDVNTIANYDRSIIPHLNAPEGSAFEKPESANEFTTVQREPQQVGPAATAFGVAWPPTLEIVKPVLRTILFVGAAVVATFIATAAYYNQRVSKQVLSLMIAEAVQMEAYNDIGRVEAYDTVEDFIRRGCVKEALQFVQMQQSLLLGGIAYRMGESDDVRKVVLARSAAVAERARAQVAQRRTPDVPRCS